VASPGAQWPVAFGGNSSLQWFHPIDVCKDEYIICLPLRQFALSLLLRRRFKDNGRHAGIGRKLSVKKKCRNTGTKHSHGFSGLLDSQRPNSILAIFQHMQFALG